MTSKLFTHWSRNQKLVHGIFTLVVLKSLYIHVSYRDWISFILGEYRLSFVYTLPIVPGALDGNVYVLAVVVSVRMVSSLLPQVLGESCCLSHSSFLCKTGITHAMGEHLNGILS